MNARKPPETPRKTTRAKNTGALRVAGVADPIVETECRVTGCSREPKQDGLCGGHYASRRGDRDHKTEEAHRG